MKRKMIGAAAAYMSGLFFASVFSIRIIPIIAVCAAVLVIVGREKHFKEADFSVIAVGFAAAYTVFTLYTSLCCLPAEKYSEKEISFSGEITDIDIYSSGKAAYVLKGSVNGEYRTRARYYCDELDAKYGDIVTIEKCTAKLPESDYLFDTAKWYKSRHIFLDLDEAEGVRLEKTHSKPFLNKIYAFREKMIFLMGANMDSDSAHFLAGMVFGEKHGMDENLRNSLYRTGIGHILAVSGLHVSVLVSFLIMLMKKLNLRPLARFFAANVCLVFVILLAKSPVSAVRAALMLEIALGADIFRQQNDALNSLSLAVLLIAVSDPYSIYNTGFILSVSGTFAAASAAPRMAVEISRKFRFSALAHIISEAVCLTVCLLPFSMGYFGEISVIAPLSNIVLLPLCIFAMIVGFVFVLTGGRAVFLLDTAEKIISPVIRAAEKASELPFTNIPERSKAVPVILAASAVFIAVFYFLSEKIKYTVYLTAAAIVVFSVSEMFFFADSYGKFTAAVLGKGSNTAVVVSYNGRTSVFDLSGHYRSVRYVRKYMTEKGLRDPCIILTKNAFSRYSSYLYHMEMFGDAEYILLNKPRISGIDAEFTDSENCVFEFDGYRAEYSEGSLEIIFEGRKLEFCPHSSENFGDFTFVFGNIPKDAVIYENVGYAEEAEGYGNTGMNNSEIIISDKKNIEIRRLQCQYSTRKL